MDRALPNETRVTFIIPARNEEQLIADNVQSIKVHARLFQPEILVLDNGSTDQTAARARENGAKVVTSSASSIAAVRNEGVSQSSGEILVFLDADVVLTEDWSRDSFAAIHTLRNNPMQVLGSRGYPEPPYSFIEEHWFARLAGKSERYLVSSHLLTSRTLFDQLGGFDEALATGEDYEFCARAIATGAALRQCPELRVIDRGYPSTALDFVRREIWHGRSDMQSFATFAASRTAWMSTLNLIGSISGSVVALAIASPMPLLSYCLFLTTLSIALASKKFGSSDAYATLASASIAALYITGRSIAVASALTGRFIIADGFRR